MSNECGPCGSSKGKPDMFLMAASPTSASTCGEGKTLGATDTECLISDPTYDVTVGAYTIPDYNTSAPVQVCNGALYSVSQWIQFINDGSVLQILSIVGNALTLNNGCPNGARVKYNSNPGTVIPRGNGIVVVAEPPCLTDEEAESEFQSQLSNATQLCVPNLVEDQSETAEMQLLGWKRADSNDSSFQKCIRRIKGIWKTDSSLFIKPIEQAPSSGQTGAGDWRSIVRHKTTGEIRERLSASENPDIEAGQKYVLMLTADGETLVGPAYIYVPVHEQLYKNYTGAMNDTDLWPNIPNATPLVQTVSLSIAAINALEIVGDTFYAHINVNLGIRQPQGYSHFATLEVNGVQKGLVGAQGSVGFNCIHLIVPVDKDDKKIDIKVSTTGGTGTPKCHVTVDLMGVEL